MYKTIIVGLLILCSVDCEFGREEGDDCEWEGVNGTCVDSHRCITTLDDRGLKPKICMQDDGETIVCCTDCELVNDTRQAVLSPTTGVYWKTGEKAWDKCLDYLVKLPYECHDSFYAGITRILDEDKQCHVYHEWGIGGPPPAGAEVRSKYPHMALLGYGHTLKKAKWLCGGTIISENFILTAAHCIDNRDKGPIKFAAFGLLDRSKPVQGWQHNAVKRIIKHPEYQAPKKYNDIALVETETPIEFNKNVLPACLHLLKDSYDGEPVATTWRDPEGDYDKIANTPSALSLKKYGTKECDDAYPASKVYRRGYDDTTQLCYGDMYSPQMACKGFSGEPLLITSQISNCFHTVIGVTSFGKSCNNSVGYDVYTKVIHYVPWIVSIVWP